MRCSSAMRRIQRSGLTLMSASRQRTKSQQMKSPAVYYAARSLTTCKLLNNIDLFVALEARVIKLDIVNAVVNRTNVSRAKAERAVETVFDSMKKALSAGQRIELRRFGVFSVKR